MLLVLRHEHLHLPSVRLLPDHLQLAGPSVGGVHAEVDRLPHHQSGDGGERGPEHPDGARVRRGDAAHDEWRSGDVRVVALHRHGVAALLEHGVGHVVEPVVLVQNVDVSPAEVGLVRRVEGGGDYPNLQHVLDH